LILADLLQVASDRRIDLAQDLRGRQLVSVKGHNEKLEVSRSYTHLFKGM